MTQSIQPNRRQLLLGGSALLLPGLAAAQAAWPTKPVRIITPFAAGGATDVIARNLAAQMQATTRQTFNVDPKPGADGALSAMETLRAPADGHHLFLVTASAFSDEKQMPFAILWPSRLRSLSFAVTMATDLPALASASNSVGARSHLASFIITSVPVAVSYR